MLRRRVNSKTAYDNDGGQILFDEVSYGGHTLYTAEVDNMISREIPVSPLFTLFGKDSVLKADFCPVQNLCRLSVFKSNTYAHTGSMVVTYSDLKLIIDSYPGGECVDALLCASYVDQGKLTLAPLIYEWKSLTMWSKFVRVLFVCLLLAAFAYIAQDSPMREFMFLVLLFIKQNILTILSLV